MRSECTKSIGCMHDCDGAATFFVSWKEVGDVIEMSIICKQSANNRYCAIGLSNDDKMVSFTVPLTLLRLSWYQVCRCPNIAEKLLTRTLNISTKQTNQPPLEIYSWPCKGY